MKKLAQGFYRARESNPGSLGCESSVLTVTPHGQSLGFTRLVFSVEIQDSAYFLRIFDSYDLSFTFVIVYYLQILLSFFLLILS